MDDSAFMRRIIRQMIESDPELEVVGMARDGKEGVDMTLTLEPDVVTMDIEIPRMDWLTATAVIMDKFPTPIIIISSLSVEGAKATFDALDKGAIDYIGKNLVDSALDVIKIQNELISKIRGIAKKKSRLIAMRGAAGTKAVAPHYIKTSFATQKIGMVAIGASTGGPRAIQEILSRLPKELTTPFVVSVHMPKAFTGAFAERINSLCVLNVKEAEDGEGLKQGSVLVSPGGVQTRIRKRGITDFYVELRDDPFNAIYKPCIDITITSVADAFPGRSMGVILTGMGHDGLEGMRQIKAKGGKTIAQNEETCTVYGMPKAVVDAGLADKVAPIEAIAGEIVNMI